MTKHSTVSQQGAVWQTWSFRQKSQNCVSCCSAWCCFWKFGHFTFWWLSSVSFFFINVATRQHFVLLAHSLVERLWLDCDEPERRGNVNAEAVTLFLLLLKWICVVDAKTIFHSAGEASCRDVTQGKDGIRHRSQNWKGRLSVVDVLSAFFFFLIGSLQGLYLTG